MDYVKIINSQVDTYPYSIQHLKRDNPKIGFPPDITEDPLVEWNVYPVTLLDAASFNSKTHVATQQTTPTFNNDKWELGWDISEKTEEQISVANTQVGNSVRHLRNELLEETDWTASSDVTMSTSMRTYRQALRDITTHSNWPYLEGNDWPTRPS